MNIEKLIDRIISIPGHGSLLVQEYIPKPVIEDLRKRGYKIEESKGVYTIKW